MKMKTEPEEGGGKVNSRKEMESKTSLYLKKKIKFLISKYKK